jgi:hypothetical protein
MELTFLTTGPVILIVYGTVINNITKLDQYCIAKRQRVDSACLLLFGLYTVLRIQCCGSENFFSDSDTDSDMDSQLLRYVTNHNKYVNSYCSFSICLFLMITGTRYVFKEHYNVMIPAVPRKSPLITFLIMYVF